MITSIPTIGPCKLQVSPHSQTLLSPCSLSGTLKDSLPLHREDQKVSDQPHGSTPHALRPLYSFKTLGPATRWDKPLSRSPILSQNSKNLPHLPSFSTSLASQQDTFFFFLQIGCSNIPSHPSVPASYKSHPASKLVYHPHKLSGTLKHSLLLLSENQEVSDQSPGRNSPWDKTLSPPQHASASTANQHVSFLQVGSSKTFEPHMVTV